MISDQDRPPRPCEGDERVRHAYLARLIHDRQVEVQIG
jgi:hypothetical protein